MAKAIPAPVGQRFGKLTVIDECEAVVKPSGQRTRMVSVQCDCGNTKTISLFNMLYGRSNSCGCNHGHANLIHGMSHTPTWESWVAMIQRCTDKNCSNYPRYGGVGITVCERWMDFQAFFSDMGVRLEGTSIDRFPNMQGNYEPVNCRWATAKEQGRNQKSNRLLTLGEVTLPLSEWAEKIGVHSGTIRTRLRDGWTVDRALTTPSISKKYDALTAAATAT